MACHICQSSCSARRLQTLGSHLLLLLLTANLALALKSGAREKAQASWNIYHSCMCLCMRKGLQIGSAQLNLVDSCNAPKMTH